MKTLNLIVILGLALACPLAADTVATETQKLSPTEIETLAGPIALYPDVLIGIILPASANSTDIVLAARFLAQGGAIADADVQPWDESVRSLAHYPDVLKWMDENLEWTQQLGATFLVQQEDVMAAIQRLRTRAHALGNLPTTEQLTVVNQDNYIRIVPTAPETIYVPYYDPEIIYVSRFYWGFGPAWVCGPWLRFDCNWFNRCIWIGAWSPRYFHHPAWGHIDRRPPPPRYTDRHTWRPDPRRVSMQPRPPMRPGTIARPRPIINPHNPDSRGPGKPPPASVGNRPGKPDDRRQPPAPGNNSGRTNVRPAGDQQRPPPTKSGFTRPPQTPATTPAPSAQLNDNGKTRQTPPPSSAQRSTQRQPRNDNARPATANEQRPARDGSRQRPSSFNNPPASANTNTSATQRPSTPPPARQTTTQPASQGDTSSRSSTPPPARTTTTVRETSDSSKSSSSTTSDSSSSRNTSRSSSETRSSSQPRQSTPPPAPRESRTTRPGAR